jgi:hypothetical protein
MTRLCVVPVSYIDAKHVAVSCDVGQWRPKPKIFSLETDSVRSVVRVSTVCAKTIWRWFLCAPNLTQLAVGGLRRW